MNPKGDDRHFPLGDRLRQRSQSASVGETILSRRPGRPYRTAPSKGARSRIGLPFLTAHAEADAATDNHRYRDDQGCPGEEEGEHGLFALAVAVTAGSDWGEGGAHANRKCDAVDEPPRIGLCHHADDFYLDTAAARASTRSDAGPGRECH